jgi:hypothetical protein
MFEKKYPFLCVSKSNLLNENLQGLFPSEVIPEFLYLGDVDIAKNKTKLEGPFRELHNLYQSERMTQSSFVFFVFFFVVVVQCWESLTF